MVDTLAVPNWSFFDPDLALHAEQRLESLGCKVHYCQGDIDHLRTVTGFSGTSVTVTAALVELCELILPSIDLSISHGVHPRAGALDVAPFISLGVSMDELKRAVEMTACTIWERFGIPIRLYEQSARPGNEHRLPILRGQMGSISAPPDFGSVPHPTWGTSIVGIRNFLLATNIELLGSDMGECRQLAKEIRVRREAGELTFAGVRALAFPLDSRGTCQLSLNFTEPDRTSFDELYRFVAQSLPIISTELIGVIRRCDLPKCTNLAVDARQVVD